jgi:hypothetical protein
MPTLTRVVPLLALLLVITACGRPIEFDPELSQVRAVNVINELPHSMVVSFDDGSGERLLGTVAARSQDRFVIAGTSATTVTLIARDESQTHTLRRTVNLVPAGTVDVRLD